ncbi:hypothetical protein Tco_1293872 [Tanacetum coccineum]
MTSTEVEESRNGDEEVTDAAKVDAGKTEEVKDDAKKAELPLTSSSLSVYSGFSDQFLKLSSDTSLISTVKDTTDIEINSLLDIKIQSEVPHIQSLPVLTVPVSVISEPSVLTPIPETPSVAPATTLLPPPSVSTIPPLRVAKLEKDVSELKKIDHFAEALATLKSQVPMLAPKPSKIQTSTIDLELEPKKSASDIRKIKKEQAEKQTMLKYTIKCTDKVALKEYDQKSALYQTMNENKSFNKNPSNHALYHALMEDLIEDENAMDKGVADTVRIHKRQHDDDEDDDEDPSAGPNQGKKTKRRRTKESESSMKPSTTKETSKGKAPSKSSKTGKTTTAQEPIKEPIAEVVMDDLETTANEDVVNDVDLPQVYVAPKTNKHSRDTWFKQPPRPPTPNPEWNKHQVYAMNRLQIHNLTQEILIGPFYNLLKGTSTSSIKLEYNMEECFKALTDGLDWNNPEGVIFPFYLTKPLPLKGRPGHLTVAVEYFFNNDLEFLKSSNPEKKYSTSIMKTKAARYAIVGIEDMVPTLWSTTKVGYAKDAKKGSKHWGERHKL